MWNSTNGRFFIQNTRLLDNRAGGSDADNVGDAFYNSGGSLRLTNSRAIDDNRANGNAADQGGGGLYNDGGDLTLTKTSFRRNHAPGAAGSGGGIFNNAGTVDLFATNFRGNGARRAGGLESNAGEVSLDRVDFLGQRSGRRSRERRGGARHRSRQVAYGRSAAKNNVAANEGGAFWNSNTGTFTATDIVLSGNTAPVGPTSLNQGGGLGVMSVNGVLIAPGSGN